MSAMAIRPSLRPGDLVHVAQQDRGYRAESVTVRLTRIRDDLARYYNDNWVWLEGYVVGPDGREGPWTQVLARVATLPGTLR